MLVSVSENGFCGTWTIMHGTNDSMVRTIFCVEAKDIILYRNEVQSSAIIQK